MLNCISCKYIFHNNETLISLTNKTKHTSSLPFDLRIQSTFVRIHKPSEELVEPKKSSFCKVDAHLTATRKTSRFLSQNRSCFQYRTLKSNKLTMQYVIKIRKTYGTIL